MAHYILIDGNSLFHRAYHALPKTLVTSQGQSINAVHGFFGLILSILESDKPDFLITAWDSKGGSFRDELMTEYKATRKETDLSLVSQFPIAEEILHAMNIPVLKEAGFEADDFLGIASEYLLNQDASHHVDLVTSDQDAYQLVQERCTVIAPISGYKKIIRYTPEAVFEKLGVKPCQIPDYKGLRGDSSDNIKGVPGIGPKTAQNLLQKFATLEDLFENIDQVEPETLRDKLRKHQEDAFLSRHVASILKIHPQDFKLEGLKPVQKMSTPPALASFQKYELKTHQARLKALEHAWNQWLALQSQGVLL